MEETTLTLKNASAFKQKALQWASQFSVCCCLDSSNYTQDNYTSLDWILAVDTLDFFEQKNHSNTLFLDLENWHKTKTLTVFGYISYDATYSLYQGIAAYTSVDYPLVFFFEPRYVFKISNAGKITVNRNYPETMALIEAIENTELKSTISEKKRPVFAAKTSKEKYVETVQVIKEKIKAGDFYEMNYCIELEALEVEIDPVEKYNTLQSNTKAPFSSFFKLYNQYILCASPERFLKKNGEKIIAQPIKGTTRRNVENTFLDTQLANQLQQSEKERAENVMIVDLLRHDITPFSKTGSIKVPELFGVYTFKTVHHLISTITSEISENDMYLKLLQNAFPPGSMTGAPKLEVLKNIVALEDMQRGIYAGSIGYITQQKDFDFNVVIRTAFYNAETKKLAIKIGSAITYDALPEQEYDECMLKASAIIKVFTS